jgi:hypothetical protein
MDELKRCVLGFQSKQVYQSLQSAGSLATSKSI